MILTKALPEAELAEPGPEQAREEKERAGRNQELPHADSLNDDTRLGGLPQHSPVARRTTTLFATPKDHSE